MKPQYLGDSKDAFKWDYLNFLTGEMCAKYLNYVAMWTCNDGTKHGMTAPEDFPAEKHILEFCRALRSVGGGPPAEACKKIHELMRSDYSDHYELRMHKEGGVFDKTKRGDYFGSVALEPRQILFFDPDVGFEPGNASEKHICYSDIANIWKQVKDRGLEESTVLVVFQHARRDQSFRAHYKKIKERLSALGSFDSTALFWCDKVMFVAIGCRAQIDAVRDANIEYQKHCRPVQALDELRKDAGGGEYTESIVDAWTTELSDGSTLSLRELKRGYDSEICALIASCERHLSLLRAQCNRFVRFLQALIPDEPEESMAETGPEKYREDKELRDHLIAAVQEVIGGSVRQDARFGRERARQHAALNQRELLAAMPELRGPGKLKDFYKAIRASALEFGFSEQEFGIIRDHRIWMLLYYARRGKVGSRDDNSHMH